MVSILMPSSRLAMGLLQQLRNHLMVWHSGNAGVLSNIQRGWVRCTSMEASTQLIRGYPCINRITIYCSKHDPRVGTLVQALLRSSQMGKICIKGCWWLWYVENR
jgi:hypothetical protein